MSGDVDSRIFRALRYLQGQASDGLTTLGAISKRVGISVEYVFEALEHSTHVTILKGDGTPAATWSVYEDGI